MKQTNIDCSELPHDSSEFISSKVIDDLNHYWNLLGFNHDSNSRILEDKYNNMLQELVSLHNELFHKYPEDSLYKKIV